MIILHGTAGGFDELAMVLAGVLVAVAVVAITERRRKQSGGGSPPPRVDERPRGRRGDGGR